MGDKDDGLGLGLSLSLGGSSSGGGNGGENGRNPPPPPAFPFKFMPSMQLNHHHRQPPVVNKPASFLANAFHSSTVRNGPSELQSMYLGGIDVNQPPPVVAATRVVVDVGEEAMVSSPNSTVSSVSGKKSIEREDIINDAAERGGSMSSQEEDDGGDAAAAAARKKLRLSKEQAAFLEETFKEHNTLNPKQKVALAKQLNLRPRQVEVWFQNRRARTKLKQTEVDCEYLKRCCENLTDENRRLQKEVNELRALKLSPQFYMNMSPPTTLTMCPQCERVAVSSSTTSSVSAAIAPGGGGGGGGGARQQPNIQPSSGSKQKNAVNPWAAIFPNQNQK